MPSNTPAQGADSLPNPAEGGVAAVDRAFAILGAFDLDQHSLSLAEIARRTGLYKSTILRLMHSLERAGFLRRLADGHYAIGHEPLRLAQLYQAGFRLRDILSPLLETLSEASGETASFYVAEDASRVVLFRVEPKRAVRFSIREGDRFPIQAGASGKVLLAFAGATDPALQAVREQYWAVSYGERDPDTASLSAPVFGVGQILKGALTLSGPSERFNDARLRAAQLSLLEQAAQATALLGGNDRPLRDALAASRSE